MRRSRTPHLGLSLLAILGTAAPARAQVEEPPEATIRLLSQTSWTTPTRPLIRITVRIINDGDETITDPVVGWQLGPGVRSRVEYETALVEGPAAIAAADTVVLPDDLAPEASIDMTITIDTAETTAIEDESLVYPLQLELRSGDQIAASMTTAVIHVIRDPLKRVWFSWWTEVATPIAFGPDGTMIDAGWEATLASGGGIVSQVEALHDLLRADRSGIALDLIVSPVALDQLERAAAGYERSDGTSVPSDAPAPQAARETLTRIQEIAASPRARLHAMPFAAPRLPALLSSGLATHLDAQWRLGDETFERILGEQPDPTVARPPGLALDQASIDAMATHGASTILGAADSVERPPQDNDFAPPPAASHFLSSGGDVTILLPDPGATSLLSSPDLREDSVLAAQVLLGELATIWKEQPVPPDDIERGLAVDLPPNLPPGFWRPAVARLSNAPFLEPVHADDLRDRILPPPDLATLAPNEPEVFSDAYVEDLASAFHRVNTFGSVVEEPTGEVDRLRRALFTAEASQYIPSEGSGRMWINAVDRVVEDMFTRIAPDTSRVLTFTSRSVTIPLRMGDPGGRVLNVRVELASGRVDFLGVNEQAITLDQPGQVLEFPVEVKAAGPSRIEVVVRSPQGVELSRAVLLVRSTAVNPIALLITVGAGLVLVALWSRRLFRRRSP
jgi:hypothetical protein